MTTLTTTIAKPVAKKDKVIYWIFTSLIVLLDSVPAIFSNSEVAIAGTRHLGFPDYFRIELGIGKLIGGLLLIIPTIPARYKEWAYVGFGISMISAFIANVAIDGFTGTAFMALVGLAILSVSYIYFHKTRTQR